MKMCSFFNENLRKEEHQVLGDKMLKFILIYFVVVNDVGFYPDESKMFSSVRDAADRNYN